MERLLDNLALEMEAFALCRVAPGWRLRLPAQDRVTFHFVIHGTGEAGGSASAQARDLRDLSPGLLLLVPPHLVHTLASGPPPHAEQEAASRPLSGAGLDEFVAGPEEEAGLLVACGRARLLYGGDVDVFEHLPEILSVDFADELFEAMLGEVRSPRPGLRAMLSALMGELLVHVFRRLSPASGEHPLWLNALDDSELGPAIRAMAEDPGRPHTVATLAGLCHMSRSTFARRFKESVRCTPMEYLRGVRLRQAARLLRRDRPPSVTQVARRVGFRSRSQFSRAFKTHFHAAPSRFARRAHGRRLAARS
jgi:AraC family transcriptional activator of mtrCDE